MKNEPDRHRYSIWVNDAEAGYVRYTMQGSTITFVSTHIEPDYRGGGYGSILIKDALEDVRLNSSRTLVPECPFTRTFLEKHPEYQELVNRG